MDLISARGYLCCVQYDAAVDPVIARTKVKEESQVAGRASVLVVPNLNVGNIVYKVGTLVFPDCDVCIYIGQLVGCVLQTKNWISDALHILCLP